MINKEKKVLLFVLSALTLAINLLVLITVPLTGHTLLLVLCTVLLSGINTTLMLKDLKNGRTDGD